MYWFYGLLLIPLLLAICGCQKDTVKEQCFEVTDPIKNTVTEVNFKNSKVKCIGFDNSGMQVIYLCNPGVRGSAGSEPQYFCPSCRIKEVPCTK